MSIKVRSTTENLSARRSADTRAPVLQGGYCSSSTSCDISLVSRKS